MGYKFEFCGHDEHTDHLDGMAWPFSLTKLVPMRRCINSSTDGRGGASVHLSCQPSAIAWGSEKVAS